MPALSYCNYWTTGGSVGLESDRMRTETFLSFFFSPPLRVCCLKTIQRLINGDRVFDQANRGVQQASVQR